MQIEPISNVNYSAFVWNFMHFWSSISNCDASAFTQTWTHAGTCTLLQLCHIPRFFRIIFLLITSQYNIKWIWKKWMSDNNICRISINIKAIPFKNATIYWELIPQSNFNQSILVFIKNMRFYRVKMEWNNNSKSSLSDRYLLISINFGFAHAMKSIVNQSWIISCEIEHFG